MTVDEKFYHVGERSNAQPAPTQDEPGPFKKSRPPEPLHFKINLTAEGACMAHFALRNPIPWSTRLVYNDREVISRKG